MSDARTQLVGAGYDARVEAWEEWIGRVTDDPRHEWACDLAARLAPGQHVLELGCGGGTAETQALAARFELTGIDLSEEQLVRARTRIPDATFLHADLTDVDLAPGSFDAVVSFYVFNHVPRELLAGVLERCNAWLAPGGWLLAAFGANDVESWTGEWLGAPTFFSSFPPAENSRLVAGAGFRIERDEVVTITEPEGPVEFQWILAQR